MNRNSFATLVTAIAIAGFTHSLAAQEKPEVHQADNVPAEVVTGKELLAESVPLEITAPAPVIVQAEEKFLSEMKIYPAF